MDLHLLTFFDSECSGFEFRLLIMAAVSVGSLNRLEILE
jgi:hypothetical protein